MGNVYRSELLFLLGLHPFVPARDVDAADAEQLWRLSVEQMRAGEKAGRIVTVEPSDADRKRRADLRRSERLYAYKRQGRPCRRCGTEIVSSDIDDRTIWWCPFCQPENG